MAQVAYWLKGSSELNFGDYLSEYLLHHLFLQTARRPAEIRLIGSVLHDGFVQEVSSGPQVLDYSGGSAQGPRERLIAWGCGIREPGGLNPDHRALVQILSVRGPVSAGDLTLAEDTPQGDPAFLLPALYKPRQRDAFLNQAICIPHFHDRRSDQDLLRQSECDLVLRPNIPFGERHIERFIDGVASARFVLSASLHGAVVAAAYRRPFAFWDPGVIDLPTKWADLAASMGISSDFVRDLPSGLVHYDAHVAKHLRIPSLWMSLAVSPYPLRADALLKVLRYELSPIDDELDKALASRLAVFEARRSHFAAIAAEGCNEVSAAVRTLAERDQQLGTLRRELELAQKQNAQLGRRIRRVEASPMWRISEGGRRIFRRITSEVLGAVPGKARVSLARYLPAEAVEGPVLTPLFDAVWYLRQNPDVRDAGMNPLAHYLQFGAAEGRNPHPLFDTAWYLRQNPDVRDAGVSPLAHYLQFGAAEGRNPHPLFDTVWYLRQNPDVRDTGMNPLAHYLQFGAAEGRNPHPLFDGHYYRETYLQDASEVTNPLLHYVTSGAARGLQPNLAFDARGYAYEHEDVRLCQNNALIHFVTLGCKAGFQPHPLFEREWYRANNLERIPADMEAYEHFVRYGLREGLLGSPALGESPSIVGPFPFSTPAKTPAVAIIVKTHDRYFDTYRCLVSISRMTGGEIPYTVAVAASDPDGQLATLLQERFTLQRIGVGHPINSTSDRDSDDARTESDFIVIFDNNAVATDDWLAPMVEAARREPRVGMVGCKCTNSNKRLVAAGGIICRSGRSYPYGRGDDPLKPEYGYLRDVDFVMSGCFLIRRSAFISVGGVDRRFATGGYQDLDLALAVQASGYSVQYQPASEIYELGGGPESANPHDRRSPHDHDLFRRKWAHALERQLDETGALFISREREHRAGTILVIDAQLEYDKHAGGLTMFQYVRLMAECGLKVVFIPSDRVPRQPYTRLLQQSGIEVLYGPGDVGTWLDEAGRFLDCVWLARPDICREYLHLVKAMTSARIVYFTHDLHFLRERRRSEIDEDPGAPASSQRLKQIETDIFNAVDCVTTPSTEEARVISTLAPDVMVRVLPLHYFTMDRPQPPVRAAKLDERREILFVGSDHSPNVDAAIVLVQSVMPIVWRSVPDARVTIAGSIQHRAVRALEGARVAVTGYVPDLQTYYDRARMSLNPLRYGAGVKGKILSSLAAGVPVITTAIGNEGIDLREGIEVLVGNTAEELAAHAVRLFNDAALLNSLAEAGRDVIAARYAKENARGALLDALNLQVCSICGRSRPARLQRQAPNRFACRRCEELNRSGRFH